MNIYQDAFFRALDLLRGRRNIGRLKFLRRSQYWTGDQLRRWQLDRLNELLAQARSESWFHGERLCDLQLPLRAAEDLRQVPILTKQQIRDNGDGIRTRNLSRLRYVPARTGGSTGKPMSYFWDKRGMDWNRGTVYRSAEWAGVALGEPTVQMSGSQYDQQQAARWINRFGAFLHRHRHCSVAWVNDEVHESYFRLLQRFRPTSIWGYASGVDLFAQYVRSAHPQARFPFLKAIITSSETLRPEQRERINEVFGPGRVHDNYGSREMYVAAECSEHDGYHVHAEVLLVEVVDDSGNPCPPGKAGRVILTDLSNHAFPFIRYEIGDVAALAVDRPCRCGVMLPKLERLEGRIADFIVLRDRVLTPPNFAAIFNEIDGVGAYQIRQDRRDEVLVLIEPTEALTTDALQYIEHHATGLVAGQADVRVITDREIDVPESGKRRFVVSSVGLTDSTPGADR